MNDTIKKIAELEEVPETNSMTFGEAADLMRFAEDHSICEVVELAYRYGFASGRNFERRSK